jgi:hypothetical protein
LGLRRRLGRLVWHQYDEHACDCGETHADSLRL